METAFDLIAVLLGLAALFGYINHKLLKLPHSIGLVVIALAVSLGALAADALIPAWGLGASVRATLHEIDFTEALLSGQFDINQNIFPYNLYIKTDLGIFL